MDQSVEKASKSWRMDEIDYGAIRREMVHDNEQLFYLLAAASFIEITSDLYTHNLIEHFRCDRDAARWLEEVWQREEMQHGSALKAYVMTVWPDFDWEKAYAGFAAEYGATCTIEALEPSAALEMVARCVVEVGTSTFYRCLYDYIEEPVLHRLLTNIKADEVRHFKRFRRYFLEYNTAEGHGPFDVARVIWHRTMEIRNEDSYIAFKHAFNTHNHSSDFHEAEWSRFCQWAKRWTHRYYPYRMAVEMLLSPLPAPNTLKKMMQPALIWAFWIAMY